MTNWREAQRRSFAFGNCNVENPKVTREIVNEEAQKMAENAPQAKLADAVNTLKRELVELGE